MALAIIREMTRIIIFKTTFATRSEAINFSGFDNNCSKVFPFRERLFSRAKRSAGDNVKKASSEPPIKAEPRIRKNATIIPVVIPGVSG
jgi:hypothetical protein